MNIRLILDLYKSGKISATRSLTRKQLIQHFIKLKIGEMTGKIYSNKTQEEPSQNATELTKSFESIDPLIRRTLYNARINNKIDINKKIGLENIGSGCSVIPIDLGGQIAITQGNADFFFLTEEKKPLTLKVNLTTIPKISGKIRFENKVIHSFSIHTLSEYHASIPIEPDLINQKISKITILSDTHWNPRYLDNDFIHVPLGIGVRSIEIA